MLNPVARANFVETAVKILEDYGLDGLDIDYEYPKDDATAKGYVSLLKELRQALNRHGQTKGHGCHFALTVSLHHREILYHS